jgi:hypothetical protein
MRHFRNWEVWNTFDEYNLLDPIGILEELDKWDL